MVLVAFLTLPQRPQQEFPALVHVWIPGDGNANAMGPLVVLMPHGVLGTLALSTSKRSQDFESGDIHMHKSTKAKSSFQLTYGSSIGGLTKAKQPKIPGEGGIASLALVIIELYLRMTPVGNRLT